MNQPLLFISGAELLLVLFIFLLLFGSKKIPDFARSLGKGLNEFKKATEEIKKVKILVGGAPVTQQFAEEIGADGYAPDAASAAEKAKQMLVAA